MKLAVLGTGMIVQEALPVLQEMADVSLEAILSTPRSLAKANKLAKQYAIAKATSDYHDILTDSQVDTVYIALPNHLHFEMAKKALLAHKHVICEKPFTMTLAELEELAALAKQTSCILVEAITNQHLANYHWIKEHLAEIGTVKIVECNYSQYSSRYDAFKAGQIAPAFDASKGGGALRDLNSYNIHFVVGLFGAPTTVSYLPNMEKGVDTSGILLLTYPDFKVVCIAAKDCSAPIRSTIQGDKGAIVVDGATNTLPAINFYPNKQAQQTINQNPDEHRMAAEFRYFAQLIAKKDTAGAQALLEHSKQVMAVLDAASQAF